MPNFCERVADAAARVPDRPAIELARDGGVDTTSYAALDALSAGYAAWLHGPGGVGRGDRVAVLAANDAHWIAAYLGVLRLGAVAVPLDTAYSPTQVAAILADAGARVILTSDRLEHVARAAADTRAVIVARLGMPLDAIAVLPAIAAVDDQDAAAVLYTSGTTADPKGVVLTHGNLEAERAAALSVIRVGPHDAVLGVLPLFHALAQMTNLLLPLSAGARVVFLQTINASTLVEALDARGITVFACVPQFFYLIHQRVTGDIARRGPLTRRVLGSVIAGNAWLRDTVGLNPGRRVFARVHRALGSRMRYLITGGSRFDPHIARDLYGLGLTLLNGYGLTETSGAATVVRPGDRFTTSVGQPLPGIDVRIAVEPAASSDERAADTGEILIRGPIVMREYFNRPDATAEALDAGWLKTGDLGRMDADGRVYITGRKKDVIVLSSGKNVYPEELETHYRASPFVRELCVMGVTDPAVPAAERLYAVVVPDDTALRARGTVNVRELIRFELEERSIALPPHKRILGFDVTFDPLPRTTTGKLKRNDIERQYRDGAKQSRQRDASTDEVAWLTESEHRTLIETIANRVGRAIVLPDDSLELDLQLDSLERVELLAALEQQTGVHVDPDVRATIFTVRQLVAAIVAGTPEPAAVPVLGPASTWDAVLATQPDPRVLRDLARPARLRARVMFALLRAVRLGARVGVRLRLDGLEHLPAAGPSLLTPNHQSYFDGVLLASALPFAMFERIFFVGAAEYFQTPRAKTIARLCNIVPVDPDGHLVNAMQAAAAGLRLGKVLILFPEGERTIDGRVRPFRKGAAILASELGAPIVPIAITGTGVVWPRGRGIVWRALRPWRRTTIAITCCPPMRVVKGDEARATEALQDTVARAVDR